MENESKTINIELPEEIAQGNYCNLCIVMHSPSEFIMDFIRMVPNRDNARVQNRIILTPDNAKRLLTTLSDNIRRYEAEHGEIRTEQRISDATFTFPTKIKGEA
ncbi:hypothetical protein HQ50_05160 [Porphyromonas sp. COT-052 OH4946]|uniref:DUF3467 domain-containing protein n=1 Tax=Porphyromonas sp. COT-052 OH4946 TaxID=1515618 RepID=UPI00051E0C88|nr:DUF3467 domain-containing protein [Porphyromonas sp. COT-052 OH4946]KGL55741.1 hypothetical protein HQ50_05160 [Porphyromonas sp. COT-052 OH4946]